MTEAGKSKSSQNSRAHGLTGKLEADPNEAEYLRWLLIRLSDRFKPADDYTRRLIQIAILAELRRLRAYGLIRAEISRMLGVSKDDLQQETAETASVVQMIRELLRDGLGDKPMGVRLAKIVAESMGLIKSTGPGSRTPLPTLVRYAERFRGQRDRALKKLEATIR